MTKLTPQQKEKILENTKKTVYTTIFGTILPLIICTIILILFSKYKELLTLITNGSFCLFAAALLTSALHLFTENNESISEKKDKRIYRWTQPTLVIAAITYAIIFANDTFEFSEKISYTVIVIISVISFAFSLWAYYRAVYLNELLNPPTINAGDERRDDIDGIKSQLG